MKLIAIALSIVAASTAFPAHSKKIAAALRTPAPQVISPQLHKSLTSIACEGHSNLLAPVKIRAAIRKEIANSDTPGLTQKNIDTSAIDITNTAAQCRKGS